MACQEVRDLGKLVAISLDSIPQRANFFRASVRARNDVSNPAFARKVREICMSRKREPNGVEPDFSEDDIQREQLGPRGVPGAPDPAKMTPQREKKTPKSIDQGHVS